MYCTDEQQGSKQASSTYSLPVGGTGGGYVLYIITAVGGPESLVFGDDGYYWDRPGPRMATWGMVVGVVGIRGHHGYLSNKHTEKSMFFFECLPSPYFGASTTVSNGGSTLSFLPVFVFDFLPPFFPPVANRTAQSPRTFFLSIFAIG